MSQSKEIFMSFREESSAMAGVSFEHLIDAKKSNIKNAVETIRNAVKNGDYDSLKGLILAVKGKIFFSDLEKELRPLAENDNLYKLEKNYSIHDTSIEQAATKTDYDFDNCNDNEYNELVEKIGVLTILKKQREEFLKSLIKAIEMVDTKTGETFTINPPIKLQKQGLKLTIK